MRIANAAARPFALQRKLGKCVLEREGDVIHIIERFIAGCLVLLAISLTPAHGTIIEGDFSGVVGSPGFPFAGGAGSTYSGSYTYDTAAPTVPLPGVFAGLGTGYAALSYVIDGTSLAPAVIGIADNNSSGFGTFDILWVLSLPTGYPSLQLAAPANLWSGTSLSNLDGVNFSDFSETSFTLLADVNPGGGVGTVSAWSQRAVTVPEPATLALLGIGFAAFGFSRKREH